MAYEEYDTFLVIRFNNNKDMVKARKLLHQEFPDMGDIPLAIGSDYYGINRTDDWITVRSIYNKVMNSAKAHFKYAQEMKELMKRD